MLFTEQLFQILEAIDCAVKVDLIDEVVCHLDVLDLHFLLRFRVLLAIRLLVD